MLCLSIAHFVTHFHPFLLCTNYKPYNLHQIVVCLVSKCARMFPVYKVRYLEFIVTVSVELLKANQFEENADHSCHPCSSFKPWVFQTKCKTELPP